MTRKLFTFAKQECMEENPDSITFQEVLTPGQLYLMFLKVTPARRSVGAKRVCEPRVSDVATGKNGCLAGVGEAGL